MHAEKIENKGDRDLHRRDHKSWDEKGLEFVFEKEDKGSKGAENL